MIITSSGRAVKRPAKTIYLAGAQRRAKAPAPWANLVWSLTERGRLAAVLAATDPGPGLLPAEGDDAEGDDLDGGAR